MTVTDLYSRYSTFTQILLDRLRAKGYPKAVDQPVAIDLQPTQFGDLHSNAYFSSIIFLERTLELHPFDLAVNAWAIQVLTGQNQKTRGIRVITPEKKVYDLRCKSVALAASGLETPRILLNPGIPLRAFGHYLTNHSIINGNGEISSEEFTEILGMIYILVPQTWYRPFQLQIFGSYYSYQYRSKPRKNEWEGNALITLGKVQSQYEKPDVSGSNQT
ncbi:hypothetical protein [Paenibacillus sp. LHD-38]|uniref:hypothetical protein n=1 Tax=Paenibacillus sp. LHD-38 TaxID=3072143 RepID=UPI002810894C|nr:hypothetical protein [Paenibacillus sp. LHD-38]MDQ8739145.1 hypothetical protein [Paenibacillus sp. LHD-38]